jgi:hypothetical protein
MQVLTSETVSGEDGGKILGCFSEGTARRVVLGGILREGVSEKSVACIDSKLQGVGFLKFLALEHMEGEGIGAEFIRSFAPLSPASRTRSWRA